MTTDPHSLSGSGPPGNSPSVRRGGWRRGRVEEVVADPSNSLDRLLDERATQTGELNQGKLAASDARTPPAANAGNDPDWMAAARREAERARHADSVAATWTPGAGLPELEDSGSAPSLVRPYARTGGRTKPVRDLSLEALVRTSVSGKEAATSPWLSPEHGSIIKLCNGTVSVAEIAAQISVPLGVARVIIADMVDLGLVEVLKTSATDGDERDPDFLRRVLSGLQRL